MKLHKISSRIHIINFTRLTNENVVENFNLLRFLPIMIDAEIGSDASRIGKEHRLTLEIVFRNRKVANVVNAAREIIGRENTATNHRVNTQNSPKLFGTQFQYFVRVRKARPA